MAALRSNPARCFWNLCIFAFLLTACTPAAVASTPTSAPPKTVTSTPLPTKTQTPTSTPTARTPPILPAPYQNDKLTPYGIPHTYIKDTCRYLLDKWSSVNSVPGTVAMVIMFHSITNSTITNSNQTSTFVFRQLMNTLHEDGFQAITTDQLVDFMEHNARIPEHSVLLVVDDRHADTYFNVLFREYWDSYHWPVVNAWISTDLSTAELWHEMEVLNTEGWVDFQAHGVVHNIGMGPGASDSYITSELQGSIDAFQLHFNKVPIAIIWPGGDFSTRSVEIARQLGYRLGFTTNPRGPVMFNWVPLDDVVDPQRPTWLADGMVNDPLMVLPRYWDTDAITHLPQVIQVGQEAASYAAVNKATELTYYDIVCATHYGPIP